MLHVPNMDTRHQSKVWPHWKWYFWEKRTVRNDMKKPFILEGASSQFRITYKDSKYRGLLSWWSSSSTSTSSILWEFWDRPTSWEYPSLSPLCEAQTRFRHSNQSWACLLISLPLFNNFCHLSFYCSFPHFPTSLWPEEFRFSAAYWSPFFCIQSTYPYHFHLLFHTSSLIFFHILRTVSPFVTLC